ncbi:MAG: serine/threonine protein kinase [Anaerolineales bacterium]|nr:serine/threonine protein kinase [Anaerolineales bacterium]
MADLIGKSLGRYHILEQLGEGGMATVYKAYDTRLETDVAVKVIRTENLAPSALERSLKRFEREAKALARLTHPNIVKVTDFGEYEDKPYLVMPYLPGGTLKQWMKGKPLAWEDSIRLLLPIARALDFAHRQNMIHRDVKPSNILITAGGEPMLTDFGIVKIFLDLEEIADRTGEGMNIGAPEYMAPEQWTGKASALSDQYALGAVLYEMVTGRKPYSAKTPMAVAIKQATEPLPRPSQFTRDLPEKMEKLLLKALARNPEDRYASMGEFAKALESALSGQQAPQRKDSLPRPKVGRAEPIYVTSTSTSTSTSRRTSSGDVTEKGSKRTNHKPDEVYVDWKKILGEIGKKFFKISIGHPKLIAKGYESPFVVQLYFEELADNIKMKIKEIVGENYTERIYDTELKFGQVVKIKLFSPDITFPDPIAKKLDSSINSMVFLGKPLDSCQPREHKVVLSILDNKTGIEYQSETFSVKVVDFAFDHVSRPLLSKVSAVVLGIGSFSMFVLTLLEQIDKTIGFTSGTAVGVLAVVIYTNFYNFYQRIRPNTS